MKIWSMPHSDMGKTVQNYNRPKVDEPLCAARGAAPPTGNGGECSRLNAGKPGVSVRYSPSVFCHTPLLG
jgi:hypothetical protein